MESCEAIEVKFDEHGYVSRDVLDPSWKLERLKSSSVFCS
jgi:hypothetical protein